MKQMSVQRRQALQTLDEKSSPFVPTKTQQIFQNSANLQLRGNTFDATHLDKFLGSGYGEKGLGTNEAAQFAQSYKREVENNRTVDSLYEPGLMDEKDVTNETTMMQHRTAHSGAPSYTKNSQAIKPTVSFMNLSREQSKVKHFVDLQDGPSSLQKREGISTLKEIRKSPLIFETERSQYESQQKEAVQKIKAVQKALFDQDPESYASQTALKTPKEARKEINTLKETLASLKDYKEQQRFMGKRDRVISKGWRHGILGVDDADSGASQVFYKSARIEKESMQMNKDAINKRRQKQMSLGMGTSDQMDLGSPEIKRFGSLFSKGNPDKLIEISDTWKSKGPVRNSAFKHYNTHQRLFVPADNVDRTSEDGCMKKIKLERSLKLRGEDFKNRGKYDIVTGVDQNDTKWIGSFGKQAKQQGYKTSNTGRLSEEASKDHWAERLGLKARTTNASPII